MNTENVIINKIYQQFRNPNSDLFLQINTDKIFDIAKRDPSLAGVTRSDVLQFKRKVESISRSFQSRILKSRPRHDQFRSWITFGPLNILLGDLCFLPPLKKHGKKTTILVLMDAFSRLVKLSYMKTNTAKETLQKFDESLAFFGSDPEHGLNFKKFACDRGYV